MIQEAKEVEAKGGISTATDLVNFAKAVNNGTNTSRWQNDAGEVVLLNDIDMSSVTSWTPIGDIDASNYTTAEPYVSGTFVACFIGQNGESVCGCNQCAGPVVGDPLIFCIDLIGYVRRYLHLNIHLCTFKLDRSYMTLYIGSSRIAVPYVKYIGFNTVLLPALTSNRIFPSVAPSFMVAIRVEEILSILTSIL